MRILIVAPAWIGDAIMAQPLYHRLKKRYRDLTLDVLAPTWSLPLLARMPEVDRTLQNPFAHGQLRLYQRWQLGHQLKKHHYNQAIVLPNSFKSALIPWFAGIPKRTGYLGEQRYVILNDARRLDRVQLPRMVDRFTALALEADSSEIASDIPPPQLCIHPASRIATLQKFGLQTDQPIAIFCPGAEYGPAKRWPPENFAALAQRLQKKGYHIWLFGSAKEEMIAHQIVRLSGLKESSIQNLCGKTQLAEAIDLMSIATVVVSNDSGLMHIAAALRRPLVALYGSSSPTFTPPLSPLAEIVSLELACSPCFARQCPLTHFNCMRHLSAEQVDAAIEKVLQHTHES
jgi:heptosyltransferase-2